MADKAKKRCKAVWPLPSQCNAVERRCRRRRQEGKDYCRKCERAMEEKK